MARLSPPRHALHRHIRLLDLRKGDDSPLRTVFLRALRAVCASPKLSTPRRRRSDPSATSQTPSPQCAATSLSLLPGACRDARVASRHDQKSCPNFGYDAVRLIVGWNHFCAISVGTTALAITAVTRMVYCSWLIMWLVRP